MCKETYSPGIKSKARLPKYCFKITEKLDESDPGYIFDVVDEGNRLRVEQMDNNGDLRYTHKGISYACIEMVAKFFEKPVVSSVDVKITSDKATVIGEHSESRSKEATGVWKKLLGEKKATYDSDEDRYCYPWPATVDSQTKDNASKQQ